MTRQQFFPLFVIMLASGMASYFALPFEPAPYALVILAIGVAGISGLVVWCWPAA